jgi:hypothetical protein
MEADRRFRAIGQNCVPLFDVRRHRDLWRFPDQRPPNPCCVERQRGLRLRVPLCTGDELRRAGICRPIANHRPGHAPAGVVCIRGLGELGHPRRHAGLLDNGFRWWRCGSNPDAGRGTIVEVCV